MLGGVLQLDKLLVVPRNVKRRSEAISQTVVRLVPVDQPQRHPVLVRVEVENPSLPQCHKAPPRSAELSPRRRAVFPGRERWKAGWLPLGCRDTDTWRPAYSNEHGRRDDRNARGLPAAERAGTCSSAPRPAELIGRM